jgi:hypothetical protein
VDFCFNMSHNVEKYTHITSTHVYGFRYGTWAQLKQLVIISGRQCYQVQFDDGIVDYWPVEDPLDAYKFKF